MESKFSSDCTTHCIFSYVLMYVCKLELLTLSQIKITIIIITTTTCNNNDQQQTGRILVSPMLPLPSLSPLSFCAEREAFHQEIVLPGIQPCFLHGGAHGLFWNATKSAKFLLNFQVHFALYGQDSYVFEREFMYF